MKLGLKAVWKAKKHTPIRLVPKDDDVTFAAWHAFKKWRLGK